MKDSTKHIIARELYFFFKWLAIGIAVAVLLTIIALVVGDVEPDWLGDAYGVLFISSFFLPIWLYLYRGLNGLFYGSISGDKDVIFALNDFRTKFM